MVCDTRLSRTAICGIGSCGRLGGLLVLDNIPLFAHVHCSQKNGFQKILQERDQEAKSILSVACSNDPSLCWLASNIHAVCSESAILSCRL